MMNRTSRQEPGRVRAVVGQLASAALLATILLVPVAVGAEGLSDIPAAFVDVGTGARQMGMGGAAVATSRGASSIFWNPAGLTGAERNKGVSLSYADVMGIVPYSAASGIMELGDTYTVGAGILRSGDDVLTETTLLAGAARGWELPAYLGGRWVDVGVTLKTRWASFGNNQSEDGQVSGSARGFGLDGGAIVQITEGATFGIAVRDVVNSLTWDSAEEGSSSEDVPSALVMGLAVRPTDNVLLAVDIDKALHLDSRDMVMAGAEVDLFGVASVRGGYRKALPPGELEEWAVGAGARVPAGNVEIALDLAYLLGHLDNTLRFSVGLGL
jgi:hypothetical protein